MGWLVSLRKNTTNLKIRDTGLGTSFLPDLSSSVRVQKIQLCIQDLLVDPASFGPPIMSDPAVRRCSDYGCSCQDPRGSEQPVEGSIVSTEWSVEQCALRAFVREDLYHFQYGKSLLRFLLGVGRQRQRLSAELFSQSLKSGVSLA